MFIAALREAGWEGLSREGQPDHSKTTMSLPQAIVALSNVFPSPDPVVYPKFPGEALMGADYIEPRQQRRVPWVQPVRRAGCSLPGCNPGTSASHRWKIKMKTI